MTNILEGDNIMVEVDGINYVGTVHKIHHVYPFEDDDFMEVVVEGTEPLVIFAKCSHAEMV